jgi:pimeloyl-ACP methyl ester carboxylesterase
MSLLGYANGGFGALHMLMRHPQVFHRVAVCDVPVLGDFNGEARPWGLSEWTDNERGGRPVEKPPWGSFIDSFPHNAMFGPYSSGTLAECEYVADQMRGSGAEAGAGAGAGAGEGAGARGGVPRIGLWSGSRTRWEMGQLREQFEIFGVPHAWSDAYEDEAARWSGGWLKEALVFLGEDL